MPKNFTNVRRSVAIPETPKVAARPYVAKNGASGLTNKEKEARRLTKKAHGEMSMNTSMATAGGFFSPQLSTDFLELPQSLREKRELYRHFYNSDPIVGQSIDLHTELPLSKVRLATPKPSTCPKEFKDAHDYGNYILWFFTEMCERIKLFQRLVTMTHHYWLDGSCVTPDTLISTPEGERPADSIQVGDELLTHRGRWRAVEKVYRHPAKQVLQLNVARLPGPLKVTGEHPVEVLRGDNFEFVPASEVLPGDWVRASYPTEESDVQEINLLEVRLAVDARLLYLIGYWFGAGTLTRESWGRGEWSVCFGKGSEAQAARVLDILGSIFGHTVVRLTGSESGLLNYSVNSNPLFIEWWAANFGCTSLGPEPKRIPSWVMHLPRDKQLHVLAGLIDSDGCCSAPEVGYAGISVGLVSSRLIHAFRDILLRVGAVPSLRTSTGPRESWIDGQRIFSDKPQHHLWVGDREEAQAIAKYAIKRRSLRDDAKWARQHSSYRKNASGVALLVRDVSTVGVSDVVNFQVAEDSTFRASFVSTHNCFIFAEDSAVEVPDDVGFEQKTVGTKSIVTDAGETVEEPDVTKIERSDREEQELAYYQKQYQGWSSLIILPIDQVKLTTYSFTDKMKVELIPAERDRGLIEQAKAGDEFAQQMVEEIPEEVRLHMEQGKLIPLGTDADEGSFVYYLSGRRGAGDDLGQSILDRCHVPGTLVTVKRGECIIQCPIEELDPDTDLILSTRGHWREFEVGCRSVEEPLTALQVAKVWPPIVSTGDHRYEVYRDGALREVKADEVVPGDYLRAAAVPLPETVKSVDLAAFMDGLRDDYRGPKSGAVTAREYAVLDRTETSFLLKATRGETNPRQLGRIRDINRILDWAASLLAPVSMMCAEACEMFQVRPTALKEIRADLLELGYGVTVAKNKRLTWPPNVARLTASQDVESISGPYCRRLELTGDLGYVVGFFLGDGYISGGCYPRYNVVFDSKTPRSVAAFDKVLSTLNAIGGTVGIYGDSMKLATFSNQVFARWVQHNFGAVCETKLLPAWVYDAPKEFLWGLLRGFVDSDGDVVERSCGTVSVRLSNSNAGLTDQLMLVCLSLGIPASRNRPTPSRLVKQPQGSYSVAKPLYAVYFSHGPSVQHFMESGFLAKSIQRALCKNGRSGARHVVVDGSLFFRVSRVNQTALYSGPVYSLNVHDDHSFFASWVGAKNCLRVLTYREKLRQAQTQIASRAMTPKRVVWGDKISELDVMDLREQVDLSLVDPDYSIVANYEVHWEEMGSKDRLLDLSSEYEITDKQLYAGLGVTESLLSGEALYSGDRLKLEVINTRYLFLREMLQEYVENYLFKPVARRKGFVEKNQWGGEVVVYPKLSFTRLPLRDSQDTYDALFNLYNKGSIDISLILEMFNIDADDTRVKLEKDLFTVNDALFNEVMRGIYGAVAQDLVGKTDVADRIIATLGLKKVEPEAPPEDGRF